MWDLYKSLQRAVRETTPEEKFLMGGVGLALIVALTGGGLIFFGEAIPLVKEVPKPIREFVGFGLICAAFSPMLMGDDNVGQR